MTKAVLSKWKAPGKDRDEWIESWERAGWLLEPLAATLLEWAGDGRFDRQDFAAGATTGFMVWDAGQRAMVLKILELLPSSAVPGGMPSHLRNWGIDKPRRPWYSESIAFVKRLCKRFISSQSETIRG